MRYHYKKKNIYVSMFGKIYVCNHPVYDRCTLYKINNIGLAVIQQRYSNKCTWWSNIDPWLVDDIYLQPKFKEYFDKYAAESINDIYPTVTVRQIMWALKMKPLKREQWETAFDHAPI